MLFIVLLIVFVTNAFGAALSTQRDSVVCLCLGDIDCFTISGVLEDDSLVTSLTDEVNIFLPLSTFKLEPLDICTTRSKRQTTGGVHTGPGSVGVHVDHQAGNTHLHGSVDAHKDGSLSASGSVSHQAGNTHIHASLHGSTNGNVGGSAGVKHDFGNGVSVHADGGVDVNTHTGQTKPHVEVGVKIQLGRK